MHILEKNRNREPFSFANINMLGKCNVNCFFCLGKDIEDILCKQDQMKMQWNEWKNFQEFLNLCRGYNITKIYMTGQNTDPLMYPYLGSLVDYLQTEEGFQVGVRTNGFCLNDSNPAWWDVLKMQEEVGLSVHTFSPMTQKMMIGRSDIPNWKFILRRLIAANKKLRVATVITRCNVDEFFDLVKEIKEITCDELPYLQVRRVSTDTRAGELMPDVLAYERLFTEVNRIFKSKKVLWGDAQEFDIFGIKCVFWRTIKTTVNSLNYFTDGTISDSYFIIEGYLANRRNNDSAQ